MLEDDDEGEARRDLAFRAFREYDGFSLVVKMIEAYANYFPDFSAVGGRNEADAAPRLYVYLLEVTLELLEYSLNSTRQEMLGVQNESEVSFLSQPSFTKLALNILDLQTVQNFHYPCVKLISVYVQAIDIEPAFLSRFLDSAVAAKVASLFVAKSTSPLFRRSYQENRMLTIFSKLVKTCIITDKGQQFILDNNLHVHLIDTMVHPMYLQPLSEGIGQAQLEEIGRVYGTLIRVKRDMREGAVKKVRCMLQEVCDELINVAASLDSLDISTAHKIGSALDSPRMQALQQLTNVCGFVERISATERGRDRERRGEFVKEVLNDELIISSLIRCQRAVLPPGRRILIEVGQYFNSSNSSPDRLEKSGVSDRLFGYPPAATVLSSMVRLAVKDHPATTLRALFTATDSALSEISASKLVLRATSANVSTSKSVHPGTSADSSSSNTDSTGTNIAANATSDRHNQLLGLGGGLAASHADSDCIMHEFSFTKRLRRKSRGSSFGQQGINVFVLGVLDGVPHHAVQTSAYSATDSQVQRHIQRFLAAVLSLEWYTNFMQLCIPHATAVISSNKDALRRLFAFYQSSLLEVSRYHATQTGKWTARPLASARFATSLQHPYHSVDDENCSSIDGRMPKMFHLRVLNQSGALIRERYTIENSRVVAFAPGGSTLEAFERRYTNATERILRYRTANGWLSECRRDSNRGAIVELLDVSFDQDALGFHSVSTTSGQKDEELKDEMKVPMMTAKESVSFAMERAQLSIKLVGEKLSKALRIGAGGVYQSL